MSIIVRFTRELAFTKLIFWNEIYCYVKIVVNKTLQLMMQCSVVVNNAAKRCRHSEVASSDVMLFRRQQVWRNVRKFGESPDRVASCNLLM
jgi:hypothetical protein